MVGLKGADSMFILVLILILILINGFFAASEMALVSTTASDIHRLKSENRKNAFILEKVTKDSTKYLSTIQVAITFAGFLSSAFAGSSLSGYVMTFLQNINITLSESIVVVIITVILSFFTLVFGELVPKRIALAKSTEFALFSAPIILVIMTIFRPFVWLLTISTEAIMKIIGLSKNQDNEQITESDIKEMIVYGHIKGLYQSEEKNMLERIFVFDDLTTKMIMTPKAKVIGLDINHINETSIQTIIQSEYSRIPVFDNDSNSIEGVILLKDFLSTYSFESKNKASILSLIREPFIINEDLAINLLLHKMRASKQHLAFVVNELGEYQGIVTMEDIIEEIIGDIFDEHDREDVIKEKLNRFTYNIDGDMIINDLHQKLGMKIINNFDTKKTIASYIQENVKEPKEQSVLPLLNGRLIITKIYNNEIKKCKLVIYQKNTKSK
jgi:putative hemolysin